MSSSSSTLDPAPPPDQQGVTAATTLLPPTAAGAITTPTATGQKPPKLTFGDRITAFFKNAGVSYLAFVYRAWGTTDTERRKIVLMQDLRLALARCWIHFLPVASTIALAYLNIGEFFIGEQLPGNASDDWTHTYFLLLQITAKLLELLIIASTGKVIMDVVRNELFATDTGLPFGYIIARYQFSDISYFWSPEFLGGWKGLRGSFWKRFVIPLFLLVCGVIAILAGPSAALLMIPIVRSNWPAGGMDFFLLGDHDTLWPTTLNINSVGGTACAAPTVDMITSNYRNMTGCIWGGYSAIAEVYKNYRMSTDYGDILMNDGTVARSIITKISHLGEQADTRPDTWSVAPSAAVGRFMVGAAVNWLYAVFNAPSTRKPHFSNNALQHRIRNSSNSVVESPVAAVRVQCGPYEGVTFNTTGMNYEFPILPLFDINHAQSYYIPITFVNSSRISTQWLPIPSGPALTNYNSSGSDWASAYLAIQVPNRATPESPPNPDSGQLFTCSIDARWAPGINTLNIQTASDKLPVTVSALHQRAAPRNITGADIFRFLPKDDGTWKTVAIERDWLDSLTPAMSNDTGYTTLSSILEQMGIDNSTGLVFDGWGTMQSRVEAAIAVLVTDGMSRIGYSNNGALFPTPYDFPQIPWQEDPTYDAIVAGTYTVPNVYPPNDPQLANGTTTLRWTVTVAGLSMKVDSWAHIIALIVLFSHAVIALSHCAYMVATQLSSDALESLLELLALVATSPPPKPPVLENTSGGIRSRKTMRLPTRVRCKDTQPASTVVGHDKTASSVTTARSGAREQIRLLIGGDLSDYNPANLGLVQVNRKYGSVDSSVI